MMCQEVFFQQAIWRHQGWGDKHMHNWNESTYRQWLECQAFHGMNHGMVFLVLRKIGHHSLQQDSTRTERCPESVVRNIRDAKIKSIRESSQRRCKLCLNMKCSFGISLHEEPSSYFPKLDRGWVCGWTTHCSALLLCWLRADTPHRGLVSSYSLCLGCYNYSIRPDKIGDF